MEVLRAKTFPKLSEDADRSHIVVSGNSVSTAGTSGGTAAHAYFCNLPNIPFFLQNYCLLQQESLSHPHLHPQPVKTSAGNILKLPL